MMINYDMGTSSNVKHNLNQTKMNSKEYVHHNHQAYCQDNYNDTDITGINCHTSVKSNYNDINLQSVKFHELILHLF